MGARSELEELRRLDDLERRAGGSATAPVETAPAAKSPDSLLSRIGTGLADPIYGAAQIADKAINPIRQMISPGATSMDDVIRKRDANYTAPEGVDWGRIGGNVANPITWAGGTVAKLPKITTAANAALQGMLAPTAAKEDESFLEEKAKQAGIGVVGGTLAKTLAGGAPVTKEARALMDQGIQPSFGQSVGGAANRIESRLTSLPLIGDAALMARTRPLKEFDKLVLSRVTNGAADTLDDANKHASKLFDDVVPHLVPTSQAKAGVQQQLTDSLANPELVGDSSKVLQGLIDKHFANFDQLSGEGIKRLDSELGFLGRKYSGGTSSPSDKTLAEEIYKIQQAFRSGLEPGLPPNLQGKLAEANKTWRDLIPINKAASSRADELVTPRSLQKAIARQQKTDVSRMRPDSLIDPAVSVLPQTVPDSGTAGRLLMGGGTLGAATGLGVSAPLAATTAGAYLGALRPSQAILTGNTKMQRMMAPYAPDFARYSAAALRSDQLTE